MSQVLPIDIAYCNSVSLLEAALHYAELGIPVFPISPGAKSPPLVPFTTAASTDLGQILHWWTQWPTANIGLAMGGEWAALDLDKKGNEDGWASYLALGGPADPPWPVQHTPTGGLHLLWRVGEELGGSLSNFTRRGPSRGMDMRTRNGYVLAAPSVVGGQTYQWGEGERDPGAAIPERLWAACVEYSTASRERSLEEFPMVEARPDGETTYEAAVARLGPQFEAFLLRGEPITDDASKDAHSACLRAFSLGWTLEDMATWGPWTYLSVLGSQPPHYAKDPWQWMWRYTVKAAWLKWTGVQTEKSPEARGGFEAQTSNTLRRTENAETNDTSTDEKSKGLDTGLYGDLKDKAEQLPRGDFEQVHAYLRGLWASGLQRSAQLALMGVVKTTTGTPLSVLREAMREIEEGGRRGAPAGARVGAEVYVRSQGKLYDPRSGEMITKDSFLTMRAREHGGDRGQAEQVWLQDQGALCEEVETLTYDPALPSGVVQTRPGTRAYNIYLPSYLRPTPGDVSPWLGLLDALHWEDDRAKDWLLDRLAWFVQRPGEKINHGLLLGGAKGIGKDSLLAPVIEAVGEHNSTTIDGTELLSDFNSYLVQTKLLIVNEIDFGTHSDRRAVAEKLKRILASPPNTLRVNEKGLKRYDIPNRIQVVGQSNHRLCMHADADERRWLMLWANRVHVGDQEKGEWARWFEGYWRWLEHGGSEHVYAHLRGRDISHISPGARPPETDWQREISGGSMTGLELWISERISEGSEFWGLPLIEAEQILADLHKGAGDAYLGLDAGRKVRLQDVTRALAALGIRRKQVSARRVNRWVIHPEGDVEGAIAETENEGVVIRAERRFVERKDREHARSVRKGQGFDALPDWF